jgi:hypothetical protein
VERRPQVEFSESNIKIQQTQLRVRLRKSNPKGEDACVDFGAARKEARKNPKLGILRHGIHL